MKIIILSIIIFTCTSTQAQPDSLYSTILRLDSIFFHAYNSCDMKVQDEFYADSIEFYHDKGGLSTSKYEILEGTRKYVCGNVSRSLLSGSVEVSPIPGYGAVEIGSHRFYNNKEKEAVPKASKFVIVWRYKSNKWQITRVISLH